MLTLLLLAAAVAAAVLVFGWCFFQYTCGRRDLPEGWERRKVEESGIALWRTLYDEGLRWLDGQETEEVSVQSDDGFLLSGVLIPHIDPRATILLFHGWHSSWELNFTCILPFLHDLRMQLVLVDQRAQGDSEGRYITYGVRERYDAAAWAAWAAERFGPDHPLFLYGLSMGATTVLMASALDLPRSVRGVIADCGFTSPREIIAHVWRSRTPFPAGFVLWLLDRYTRVFADFSLDGASTIEAVAKTKLPILFLHGTADRFVPSYMTTRAHDACRSEKYLILVEGADHGQSYLMDKKRVEDAVAWFLNEYINRR